MKKINVAVFGAAGYTGEELIRLLIKHPRLQIACVTSREYAGQKIGALFPRFDNLNLRFSLPDIDKIASQAEAVFLCLPHGKAVDYVLPLVEKGLRVFDISADFRLRDQVLYKEYYQMDHPAPSLLSDAIYGLPEKNREKIKGASIIACPGCYPTSIILPVYPMLNESIAAPNDIVISSMSGVTGAGRKADVPLLFSECNESVRAYSIVNHRHRPEIEQELSDHVHSGKLTLNFVPHLVPINRGLLSTVFLNVNDKKITVNEISEVIHQYYENEPFIRILPLGKLADTKHVVSTNFCEIGLDLDDRSGKLIMTSAIDNLTKGASGQAIQCMNISYGFNETEGLI